MFCPRAVTVQGKAPRFSDTVCGVNGFPTKEKSSFIIEIGQFVAWGLLFILFTFRPASESSARSVCLTEVYMLGCIL